MTVEDITLELPNVVAMKMVDGPFFLRKFSGALLRWGALYPLGKLLKVPRD